MNPRYGKSTEFLKRACKTIPLGSQTFSKSKVQVPEGAAPFFLERGQGAQVWDLDGNEYVDFVNSLLAIFLGYNDPDVNRAVEEQMKKGTIFSLPSPIEAEVAEMLVDMIPCAEMVRYGKNGSDATSGCIRLARAFTGRDRIAVCGYHGWQDWYIGTTARNRGVPEATRKLTHTFTYNNIESLQQVFKQNPNEFAAVIMEPMNVAEPEKNFLGEVKDLAHKNGALFILDEVITGFRFAKGGAQEYFGVTPDLAAFGKGMGNGYPISAVVGRANIMHLMEEIFFSTTLGGETLSLAASKAVIQKINREPVVEHIHKIGKQIISGAGELVKKYGLENHIELKGHPAWSFMAMKDFDGISMWEVRTLFLQEMFKNGIVSNGGHNISYAHKEEHLTKLMDAYNKTLPVIAQAIKERNFKKYLECEVLQPLYRVR
ncbi:MAG: aminotransferase class III-fold pyridoxal phosphate-dependent enzyme [Pseudobdellovibrionaceae bacterium]